MSDIDVFHFNISSQDPLKAALKEIKKGYDTIVYVNCAALNIEDLRKKTKTPVYIPSQLIGTNAGEVEPLCRNTASVDTARVVSTLGDLKVNNTNISGTLAIFFTENFITYEITLVNALLVCMEKYAGKIAILMSDDLALAEESFLQRLTTIPHVKSLKAQKYMTEKMESYEVKTLPRISEIDQTILKREFNFSADDQHFPAVHQVLQDSVMMLSLANSPLYYTHTQKITKSLSAKGVETTFLSYDSANPAIFDGLTRQGSIFPVPYTVNIKPEQEDELDMLVQNICLRLKAAYNKGTILRTWSPLYLANNPDLVKAYVRQVLSLKLYTEGMIQRLKPRSIFTPITPSHVTDMVVSIAQRDKIPVHTAFSCMINGTIRSWPLMRADLFLAAGGEDMTKIISQRHRNPDAFAKITGAVFLQNFTEDELAELSGNLRAELQIPVTHKVISILTSRDIPENEDKWLIPLIDYIDGVEGATLILKPHPNEVRYASYDNIREAKKDSRNLIWSDENAQVIIGTSDIVITDASTIGIEAISIGKPVIQAIFSGRPQASVRYVEDGVAFGASTAKEMIGHVGSWIKNPILPKKMQKDIVQYLDRFDYFPGEGPDNVADLLANYHRPIRRIQSGFLEHITHNFKYYGLSEEESLIENFDKLQENAFMLKSVKSAEQSRQLESIELLELAELEATNPQITSAKNTHLMDAKLEIARVREVLNELNTNNCSEAVNNKISFVIEALKEAERTITAEL